MKESVFVWKINYKILSAKSKRSTEEKDYSYINYLKIAILELREFLNILLLQQINDMYMAQLFKGLKDLK